MNLDNDVAQIAGNIQRLVNDVSKERYDDGWNDAIDTIAENMDDSDLKKMILTWKTGT